MCFFNSITADAASIVDRYRRNMTRQLEQFDQNGNPFKPAYAHPNSIIIGLDKDPVISEWGLIPSTVSENDMERYRKQNWFINARAEDAFGKWPYKMYVPTSAMHYPLHRLLRIPLRKGKKQRSLQRLPPLCQRRSNFLYRRSIQRLGQPDHRRDPSYLYHVHHSCQRSMYLGT